ncbi:MAG: AraC family transcriptional regulator [Parasporobacterium sp.]|nr:AraC family transcriptional regulator [Parasporobacterium sp.]
MEGKKHTVGYTESEGFRCLEDLQESRFVESSKPIRLDYCGTERCKAGYSFGPYTRQNYVIHLVLEGKGYLHVGEKVYEITANQAFLLRPGVETFYQADNDTPWEYAWVGFHGPQSEKIIARMGFARDRDVVRVGDARVLAGYINNMLDHRDLTYVNYLKRGAYLDLLVADIIQFADIPEQTPQFSEEAYVDLAIENIISNYDRPVRIAKVADRIGINRSYLSIIFKKKTGVSPQQYLIRYRMEKSAELLTETELSIRAVAMAVGYSDPLTFSKAFKQHYGVSPTIFRENRPELFRTREKGDYTGNYDL